MNTQSDNFKNEEAASNYGYLSGYTPNRTASIEEIIADFQLQINKLDSLFNCGTGFDIDWLVQAHALCPPWVEKFFAQMPWQAVAPTYGEAVEKVLVMIKNDRGGKFNNYREGHLGQGKLRQSAKRESRFQKLAGRQEDYDILVVPAQFGARHKGRSVHRARKVMQANECGIGAFDTGSMLLTHPERLQHCDDLWIDCAGDEYAPGADGVFSSAPFFVFLDGQVGFGGDWVDRAFACFGSASAFVPQS